MLPAAHAAGGRRPAADGLLPDAHAAGCRLLTFPAAFRLYGRRRASRATRCCSRHSSSSTCSTAVATQTDVYVRWGAETCSSLDTEVYRGFSAGGAGTDSGSGANYLCLTPTGSLEGTSIGNEGSTAPRGAELWSTEWDFTQYAAVASFGSSVELDAFEVPCTVCMRNQAVGFHIWGTDMARI